MKRVHGEEEEEEEEESVLTRGLVPELRTAIFAQCRPTDQVRLARVSRVWAATRPWPPFEVIPFLDGPSLRIGKKKRTYLPAVVDDDEGIGFEPHELASVFALMRTERVASAAAIDRMVERIGRDGSDALVGVLCATNLEKERYTKFFGALLLAGERHATRTIGEIRKMRPAMYNENLTKFHLLVLDALRGGDVRVVRALLEHVVDIWIDPARDFRFWANVIKHGDATMIDVHLDVLVPDAWHDVHAVVFFLGLLVQQRTPTPVTLEMLRRANAWRERVGLTDAALRADARTEKYALLLAQIREMTS